MKDLIERYEAAKVALLAAKDAEFPRGSQVRYKNALTRVVLSDGCPPDRLALLFENGNTWWKPILECTAVKNGEVGK